MRDPMMTIMANISFTFFEDISLHWIGHCMILCLLIISPWNRLSLFYCLYIVINYWNDYILITLTSVCSCCWHYFDILLTSFRVLFCSIVVTVDLNFFLLILHLDIGLHVQMLLLGQLNNNSCFQKCSKTIGKSSIQIGRLTMKPAQMIILIQTTMRLLKKVRYPILTKNRRN